MLTFIRQKDCSINNLRAVRKRASTLLLLLFSATGILAQPDPKVPDGIYYIKNNNDGTWYLWPSVTVNTQDGYQYLTTSNATSVDAVNQDGVQYGPFDNTYPRWVLKNIDPATNTIQLINPKLDKYIVIRNKSYGDRDVWLADPGQATDITYTYMVLNNNDSPYKISPHPGLNNVDNTSGYSLNSAQGSDRKWLTWSTTGNGDKPQKGENRGGLIQFYASGTPLWSFIDAKLSAPTINYNSTSGSFTFEFDALPDGYDIIYTIDGTAPTLSNGTTLTAYDGHHITAHDCTVRAVVARYGVVLSEIASERVYPPSTSPDDPTIQAADDCSNIVTITSSDGADIYYTLDGTAPDNTCTLYSGPFRMPQAGTVKAIAYYGNIASGISSYNFTSVYSESPSISVSDLTVTISGSGTVYYTLDGTEPTTNSTVYTGPITLDEGQGTITVKAIAVQSGLDPSCPTTESVVMSYIIDSALKLNDLYLHTTDECIVTADIDASGFNNTVDVFSGSFDGGLHTINGLTKPLFNNVTCATVRNVILKDVSINGTGNTGAIANNINGTDTNISSIYNCGVLGTSTVSGTGHVGSLVGHMEGYSRVINCYSFATVSGGTETGGLVGYNSYPSGTGNIRTMVMNCLYYGNCTVTAPIYGGLQISNDNEKQLNNYNYFINGRTTFTKANGALAADERFLTRFEFYRLLLNSNRELAACYATGNADNARTKMAKWVLDTDIAPYPILKVQGRYPSIINYDPDSAPQTPETQKTLTVNITGTGVTTHQLTLTITDKDPSHYNYNYHKVQLPYFNDVGTGNYTDNKVVTGWKITSISGTSTFSTETFDAPSYNFADRSDVGKDKFDVSGRVFSQGAYFDVPAGVSEITIEPYWADCVYLSDTYYDGYGNTTNQGVVDFGKRYSDNKFNNQTIYSTFGNALGALNNMGRDESSTVYDYAVVLVGNFHQGGAPRINTNDNRAFTIMSADLDGDNEPDYSMIYNHQDRVEIPPLRFDFINVPSNAAAQKSAGSGIYIVGIYRPRGWLEITNTCLIHFNQFEYDFASKSAAPLILQGGVYEQFVSAHAGVPEHTTYIHLGGNAWFKQFCNGVHIKNSNNGTKHTPISVTGGEYESFYLSGMFKPDSKTPTDNAECYIDGGLFGQVAGAGHEQIKGNVTWLIDHADIDNFYGGGINTAKPILGDISVTISNSNVGVYCGGPKFGNMQSGKTVTTVASNSVFDTFYGAGYGGTAFYREQIADEIYNASNNYNTNLWQTWAANYSRGTYHKTAANGIGVNFEYEFFDGSNNITVARLYVNYATLSLAETQDVSSTLTGCTIRNNFYGGGNLGKVDGTITSVLEDCTVNGNVFGSGFSATAPTVDIMNGTTGAFVTEPSYNPTTAAYTEGVLPETTTYTWSSQGSKNAPLTDDGDTHLIFTNVDLTTLGEVNNAVLTIRGTTHVMGNLGVFGGGEKSGGTGSVTVNIEGGTIDNDVYGGGALANTNTGNINKNNTITTDRNVTNVNLLPGATIMGDVYGGGRGQKAAQDVEAVEAIVYGDVTVHQQGAILVPSYDADSLATSGRIFGCNNANGTPKGHVLVYIENTVKASSSDKFALSAVYGGGNEAEYVPYRIDQDDSDFAEVIIDGCDNVSIHSIYGGGNAASTPATKVTISGAKNIMYVFGGGNGAGQGNPGANVGYHYYSEEEYGGTTPEAIARRRDAQNNLAYGSGIASTNIYGGKIHNVFGGSNTKGNIRQASIAMLDELSTCPLVLNGIHGGGREAYMEGKTILEMGCTTGMPAIYGGSENADVGSNITLTLTSGHFDKVFGGNNKGGRIFGSITVNIEQTGCLPITIDELYLGGNNAPYSVFGYKDTTYHDVILDGETIRQYDLIDSADVQLFRDPELHLRSFASIGKVFGGGNGEHAIMVGDPTVEINVTKGWINGQYIGTLEEYSQYKGTPQELPRDGVIDTVFGGGNEAIVIGNTYVLIGTRLSDTITIKSMDQLYNTIPETGLPPRSNIKMVKADDNDIKTITYTVVDQNGDSVAGKDPLTVHVRETVNGATITGNVYGGGNNADVTQSTNIQIGPNQ